MSMQEPVPDLLHRFTPAPQFAELIVEGILLAVQTNDSRIITEMRQSGPEEIRSQFQRPVLVRVVRDDDAPTEGSEIVVMSSWPVVTLLAGTGTMLLLDRERREVLGFLSNAVSAERFVRELLPIFLKTLRDEPRRPALSI